MEYIFTVKYELGEEGCDPDAAVGRLGAAGCTDALVGVGESSYLALEFSREADSMEEAVRSALADVKAAIPSAKLAEISPDILGL